MIEKVRNMEPKILVVGNHQRIIQSILDFDYISGKEVSSVSAIVTNGKKTQKFFWGNSELLVPIYTTIDDACRHSVESDFLLGLSSANSAPTVVRDFFTQYPDAKGVHLFAENLPERNALLIIDTYFKNNPIKRLCAGASGVGLCIPSLLKLGAIGGLSGSQLAQFGRMSGNVAVICSSGGMTNELMYQVAAVGAGVSFAVSYGGDRFPITSPLEWIIEAENDPDTKEIVFFGELGGRDEYAISEAVRKGKIKKNIRAYIAGFYENEKVNIQFGHAKALAKDADETARAKTRVLKEVGVHTFDSFQEFLDSFSGLTIKTKTAKKARAWDGRDRHTRKTNFTAYTYQPEIKSSSFTESIVKRILRSETVSKKTVIFFDLIFRELIDHGPNVSGAVAAMIAARAGRDLSTVLASGVLTVGDRFGGAIHGAAKMMYESVQDGHTPEELVAHYSGQKMFIPGIGHLKYSIHKPDPRVAELVTLAEKDLTEKTYFTFAKGIERLTTAKKQNLILNIDGMIAALVLDYLVEKEHYGTDDISELLDIEFFNAIFLIARSVGFIGHGLDQKRIDEGLFRLSDDDILFLE